MVANVIGALQLQLRVVIYACTRSILLTSGAVHFGWCSRGLVRWRLAELAVVSDALGCSSSSIYAGTALGHVHYNDLEWNAP